MLLCGTVAVIMVTAGYAPGCYWRLCSKMASELSLTLERGGSSWDSDTRDFFCSVSLFQKHGVLHSFSVIRFQSIIPGSPGSLCEESIAGS